MKNALEGLLVLAAMAGLLAACDDAFLTRSPLDNPSVETYFETESDLEAYIDGLYSYLPGSGIFSGDFQSDNVEQKNYNQIVAGQHTVETSAEDAGWTWDYLRGANLFLENYERAELPPETAAHYAGIARCFRAWFYFDKVKRFGDVPWYSRALEPADPDLYKARDPRAQVMDSLLADLNFASEHVAETPPSGEINRWVTLALEARVALHEGTFRKYHGLDGAGRLLEEAADAAKQIIDGGEFTLYSTGDIENDYRNLFVLDGGNSEVILYHAYDADLEVRHTANGTFITGTLGAPGLTKSLVNTYLMRDGAPFTSLPGHDTLSFHAETQDRDPRLTQTMRAPGYTRIEASEALVPDFDVARTGYQPTKFVASRSYDSYNTNVNDLPIFRYAEVLLIYAEARAELGQLTQGDLDVSINLLRDRVGMPRMQLGSLSVDPILAERYPNVGGPQRAAILEIRRERRVEMAMEGLRYDDLMRWQAGPLLALSFQGMYFSGTGEFDLDQNGAIDVALVPSEPGDRRAGVQYLVLGNAFVLSDGVRGNVVVHPNVNKAFDESKHYLFPLPRTELIFNENLVQNPGW